MTNISTYVKYQRKRLNLNKEQLADKAGVGIRFITGNADMHLKNLSTRKRI